MKRLFKAILLSIVALLIISMPILAAVAYRAAYTIVESGGTSYDMLAVLDDVDNQWLADNGFIQADALDTRIETLGGLEKPHMVADNKTLTAVVVPANSQTNLYFTTANSGLSSMAIITGLDGYVTIDDDATLELGSDFEIEQSGYIDTDAGSDKNLVYKEDAFRTYIDGATDITSRITHSAGSDTFYLLPDGAGDYTNLDLSGAPTNWQAVDDPVATPDDETTYVEYPAAAQAKDAYTLSAPTWLGNVQTSIVVTVYFRHREHDATGDGKAQPFLRLDTNETTGTEVNSTTSFVTTNEVLGRPGGGSWSASDFDDLQVVIGLREVNALVNEKCTQIYVKVEYDYETHVEVTATGISSGEYTVTTSLNSISYDFATDYTANTTIAVNMGAGLIPVFLLEEQELTAAAASVTFSNINTLVANWDSYAGVTSRHLVVMVNAANTFASNERSLLLRFNGDAGANYNHQLLYAQAAAATASRVTGNSNIQLGWTPAANIANAYGGGVTLIPHAFNTTNHKTTLTINGAVEEIMGIGVGRWANVSAITSILLYPDAATFAIGSTFWLGVVDERYLVEEDLNASADFLPVFDSIPQDGSDLAIIGYASSDVAAVEDEVLQELNNDAVAANYPSQELLGRLNVTSAASPINQEVAMISGDNATANAFGAFYINYSQYAETSNDTHILSLSGYHESTGPTSEVRLMSSRWNDAGLSAITKIELYPNAGGNFLAGSLFSLYRVPRTVIDRQELTVAQATITFSNIPQGYEALQLLVYARSDVAALREDVLVSYNTDVVAANYDTQTLDGTGAVVTAARNAASRVLLAVTAANEGANEFGGGLVTISNYAKTDRHKHATVIDGLSGDAVFIRSERWEDTAAITRIDLTLSGGNDFIAGSVFELVGVFPQDVFSIEIDGELRDITDGNNASVPDNSNDWLLNQNNVMPYMDYYKHTVGGVQHSWYQPNYMVEATDSSGTETAGGSATLITAAEITEAIDYWVGGLVTITGAGGAAPEDEARVVTSSTVGTLTVAPAFSVNVDIGDTFTVDFGTLIDRSAYSLGFDGVNDYVDLGNGLSLDVTTAFTIEAWIYPLSIVAERMIYSAVNVVARNGFFFETDGSRLRLSLRDAITNKELYGTVGAISVETWFHIVGVFTGTQMLLYINGAEDTTTADVLTPTTNTNFKRIGTNWVATGSWFNGLIDGVRLYNRALDLAEIQANYNSGVGTYIPFSSTGLVLQLHMEEGTGGTTADSSGEGNTGTITGATWVNGKVPRPAGNSGTNDSRVTWGVNPTGVAVTLGGMVSEDQPVPGVEVEAESRDIMPPIEVSDWYVEPPNVAGEITSGPLLTNPLRPFVTMLSDNSGVTELQAWRLYGSALLLMVTVGTAYAVRGHQGITMMVTGAAMLGLVVLTIYPMWTLVLIIIMFMGGLVMERSQSL